MLDKYTLEQFRQFTAYLTRRLEHGCGNHGCKIKPPVGQGTNSGCSCKPRVFARDLRNIASRLDEYGHHDFEKGESDEGKNKETNRKEGERNMD